jgi:hypothetical protein
MIFLKEKRALSPIEKNRTENGEIPTERRVSNRQISCPINKVLVQRWTDK